MGKQSRERKQMERNAAKQAAGGYRAVAVGRSSDKPRRIGKVNVGAAARASGRIPSTSRPWRVSDGKTHPVVVRRLEGAGR